MEPQLFLISDEQDDTFGGAGATGDEPGEDVTGPPAAPSWRLDEHTRTVGRQGIERARAALRRAAARSTDRPAGRRSAA